MKIYNTEGELVTTSGIETQLDTQVDEQKKINDNLHQLIHFFAATKLYLEAKMGEEDISGEDITEEEKTFLNEVIEDEE